MSPVGQAARPEAMRYIPGCQMSSSVSTTLGSTGIDWAWSRSVNHQEQGIWVCSCRWGCTGITWRHREEQEREKQILKSLESGVDEEEHLQKEWLSQQPLSKEEKATRWGWWVHGFLASERIRCFSDVHHFLQFPKLVCRGLLLVSDFLPPSTSSCSALLAQVWPKHQRDWGRAGMSCIIFQHLEDQHFWNAEEAEMLKTAKVRKSVSQMHWRVQRAHAEEAEEQ